MISISMCVHTLALNYSRGKHSQLRDGEREEAIYSRIGILQEGCESQGVHPLIHALAAIGGKVVRPHVGVLGLEGELLVDLVLGSAHRDAVRRKQYRAQKLFLLRTCEHTTQNQFLIALSFSLYMYVRV